MATFTLDPIDLEVLKKTYKDWKAADASIDRQTETIAALRVKADVLKNAATGFMQRFAQQKGFQLNQYDFDPNTGTFTPKGA